jgi:hypothetical protein
MEGLTALSTGPTVSLAPILVQTPVHTPVLIVLLTVHAEQEIVFVFVKV